jgi:hypothetical protein
MSLRPPQTKAEGKFQYCNYGYDTAKFKSFDDCMKNYNNVFYPPTETDLPNPYEVTCKDGTKDVGNGKNLPCLNHGGVKNSNVKNTIVAPETFLQKHKNHLLIAGALVLGYFAYKKFKK